MMKRKIISACLLFVSTAIPANAHYLFLKLDTYFFQPNSKASVCVMSGTFQKSNNLVKRDRLRDASLIAPSSTITSPPLDGWRNEGDTAIFDLQAAEAGTYVIGVSTKQKEIELSGSKFNHYLEHDGIPDILTARRENNQLNSDARERFSKHVKAIFQVGESLSNSFKTPLNYPVEIIPQQNPYSLKAGEILEVLCLRDGKPLANQYVMAGWERHSGELPPLNARTDANGLVRFELKEKGKWYIQFIHMTVLKDQRLNYESNWATLTFELR
jgi:hypothetical protein